MSIGYHIGTPFRSPKAFKDFKDKMEGYGFTNIVGQVFTIGPQRFHINAKAEDRIRVKKFIQRERIDLYVHCAYIHFPWGRKPELVKNILAELTIASEIGAKGIIFHLGDGAYNDERLKFVIENLNRSSVKDVVIYLEINAQKQSNSTFETPEKITSLFHRISKHSKKKIGLCIDTAHLYSCGVSLETAQQAEEWFNGLPNIPIVIHLNDSLAKKAGTDIHAGLTKGYIWGKYAETGPSKYSICDSGLFWILQWAEKKMIPVILERGEKDLDGDLQLIAKLGFFQDGT